MTLKRAAAYGISGLIALGAAYGAGRFTAPSKVVKEVDEARVAQYEATIKQLSAEVETARTETAKHVVVVTRTNRRTGVTTTRRTIDTGTVTETRREERTETAATETHTEAETRHEVTVTEHEYPRLTVGVDVGAASFKDFVHPRYGIHAGYRFWGPLSVTGRFEPRDRAVFLGLALTF